MFLQIRILVYLNSISDIVPICHKTKTRHAKDETFKPFVNYDVTTLKIINFHYLQYVQKTKMYMKTFLIILKNRLSEKYPDVSIDFYVSRRSKFVHMGLDMAFYTYTKCFEMIAFIESLWKKKK